MQDVLELRARLERAEQACNERFIRTLTSKADKSEVKQLVMEVLNTVLHNQVAPGVLLVHPAADNAAASVHTAALSSAWLAEFQKLQDSVQQAVRLLAEMDQRIVDVEGRLVPNVAYPHSTTAREEQAAGAAEQAMQQTMDAMKAVVDASSEWSPSHFLGPATPDAPARPISRTHVQPGLGGEGAATPAAGQPSAAGGPQAPPHELESQLPSGTCQHNAQFGRQADADGMGGRQPGTVVSPAEDGSPWLRRLQPAANAAGASAAASQAAVLAILPSLSPVLLVEPHETTAQQVGAAAALAAHPPAADVAAADDGTQGPRRHERSKSARHTEEQEGRPRYVPEDACSRSGSPTRAAARHAARVGDAVRGDATLSSSQLARCDTVQLSPVSSLSSVNQAACRQAAELGELSDRSSHAMAAATELSSAGCSDTDTVATDTSRSRHPSRAEPASAEGTWQRRQRHGHAARDPPKATAIRLDAPSNASELASAREAPDLPEVLHEDAHWAVPASSIGATAAAAANEVSSPPAGLTATQPCSSSPMANVPTPPAKEPSAACQHTPISGGGTGVPTSPAEPSSLTSPEAAGTPTPILGSRSRASQQQNRTAQRSTSERSSIDSHILAARRLLAQLSAENLVYSAAPGDSPQSPAGTSSGSQGSRPGFGPAKSATGATCQSPDVDQPARVADGSAKREDAAQRSVSQAAAVLPSNADDRSCRAGPTGNDAEELMGSGHVPEAEGNASPECGSPRLRDSASELSGSGPQQLSLAAVQQLWGGVPPAGAEGADGSGSSSPTSWDSEERDTIKLFLEPGPRPALGERDDSAFSEDNGIRPMPLLTYLPQLRQPLFEPFPQVHAQHTQLIGPPNSQLSKMQGPAHLSGMQTPRQAALRHPLQVPPNPSASRTQPGNHARYHRSRAEAASPELGRLESAPGAVPPLHERQQASGAAAAVAGTRKEVFHGTCGRAGFGDGHRRAAAAALGLPWREADAGLLPGGGPTAQQRGRHGTHIPSTSAAASLLMMDGDGRGSVGDGYNGLPSGFRGQRVGPSTSYLEIPEEGRALGASISAAAVVDCDFAPHVDLGPSIVAGPARDRFGNHHSEHARFLKRMLGSEVPLEAMGSDELAQLLESGAGRPKHMSSLGHAPPPPGLGANEPANSGRQTGSSSSAARATREVAFAEAARRPSAASSSDADEDLAVLLDAITLRQQ